jgi:cholesterol transport system auxiliary component
MTSSTPSPARRALLLSASALLPACSLLPTPAPVDVYQLPTALPRQPATAPMLPLSLRVTRPAASALLAGQRLLVQPEGDRISYYKGAQWSEPAPVLLRNRLLDALRADGRIATLSSDERILQADFELDGELRRFQSVYRDGQPEVQLLLELHLVRTATQRILASRRFELAQAASGSSLPAVVQAFGSASDRLALEVTQWTVEELQQAAR